MPPPLAPRCWRATRRLPEFKNFKAQIDLSFIRPEVADEHFGFLEIYNLLKQPVGSFKCFAAQALISYESKYEDFLAALSQQCEFEKI